MLQAFVKPLASILALYINFIFSSWSANNLDIIVWYMNILYMSLVYCIFGRSKTKFIDSMQYTGLNWFYKLKFVNKSTDLYVFLYGMAKGYMFYLIHRYQYILLLFTWLGDNGTILIKLIPHYYLSILRVTYIFSIRISHKAIITSVYSYRCLYWFYKLQSNAISKFKLYYALEIVNHSYCCFEMADTRICILFP